MRATQEGTVLAQLRRETAPGEFEITEHRSPSKRSDPRSEPHDTFETPAKRPSSPTLALDLGTITEAIRESEPPAPSERFPRVAVVLEALALADAMRMTAQTLELLCGQADKYEPVAFGRHVRQVARALVVQVGKRGAL